MAIHIRNSIAACYCFVCVSFVTVSGIQANDLKKQEPIAQLWERTIDGVRDVFPISQRNKFVCRGKNELLLLNGIDGTVAWRLDKSYSTLLVDGTSDRLVAYDPVTSTLDTVSLADGRIEASRRTFGISQLLATSPDGFLFVTYQNNTLIGMLRDAEPDVRPITSIATLAEKVQANHSIKRLKVVNVEDKSICFAINGHLGTLNTESFEALSLNVQIESYTLLDHSGARLYSIRSKHLVDVDLSQSPPTVKELAEIPDGDGIGNGFVTRDGKRFVFAGDTAEHQPAYLCDFSLDSAVASVIPWGSEQITSFVANDERTLCITTNRAGAVAGWALK